MKRIFSTITVVGLTLLFAAGCSPMFNFLDSSPTPLKEYTLEGEGKDKILLIEISGMISDAPKEGLLASKPSVVEQVVMQLNKAAHDKNIKALLLKINSSGGTITASDLLYHEISAYKKKTGNRVTVIMMDLAASGAYYLSLPADMIMAHPTTLTGSVGVIFLRPKAYGLMDKIGLGVEVSKSGKDKDMGSPFRESSAEEKKLFQQTVDNFGKRFMGLVQKHRQLDDASYAEVATARLFNADEALGLRLIDEIGYISDAVKQTRQAAGLDDNARVVVYRGKEIPDENYYRVSPPGAANPAWVNIELPEIMKAKAGFYYLWPGAAGFE
ncbi:MAG TPA: signal peptide peptidase SppA [Smithellaceae bacterium]|nr:signal peptide peptidase SppA [Smithellaceae bacterium]